MMLAMLHWQATVYTRSTLIRLEAVAPLHATNVDPCVEHTAKLQRVPLMRQDFV